jgi:hypothetical protein
VGRELPGGLLEEVADIKEEWQLMEQKRRKKGVVMAITP